MEAQKNQCNIVLFFTRGQSLRKWDKSGMFPRETALYTRLVDRGIEVSFVTYGDRSDLSYSDWLPGINILCNRWRLPQSLYERWIPWLHRSELSRCTVIKTNQTDGADVALRAAKRWRKPLVARCGYLMSYSARRTYGPDSPELKRALDIEQLVYSSADVIVVTTQAMADDIIGRIDSARPRLTVIPNYVDTDLFAPEAGVEKDIDVVFVGRMSDEKNVDGLLKAVDVVGAGAVMIGDGDLRPGLEERFRHMADRVQWLGNIPNTDLPHYLNRAKVFAQPSFYEGHPKTVLEAMACGATVLGGDSPGIRESIRHGEDGWLCGTDSASIGNALTMLLGDADLRAKLGAKARQHILDTMSLDKVVETELQLHRSLTCCSRRTIRDA